jgi:hypothetical protein
MGRKLASLDALCHELRGFIAGKNCGKENFAQIFSACGWRMLFFSIRSQRHFSEDNYIGA